MVSSSTFLLGSLGASVNNNNTASADSLRHGEAQLAERHRPSIGRPFMDQRMLGLGCPRARQVMTPVSSGARTRFLGALIQYGAAADQDNRVKFFLTIIDLNIRLNISLFCNMKLQKFRSNSCI